MKEVSKMERGDAKEDLIVNETLEVMDMIRSSTIIQILQHYALHVECAVWSREERLSGPYRSPL